MASRKRWWGVPRLFRGCSINALLYYTLISRPFLAAGGWSSFVPWAVAVVRACMAWWARASRPAMQDDVQPQVLPLTLQRTYHTHSTALFMV